jgi:hypothetical protein
LKPAPLASLALQVLAQELRDQIREAAAVGGQVALLHHDRTLEFEGHIFRVICENTSTEYLPGDTAMKTVRQLRELKALNAEKLALEAQCCR